MKWTKKDIQTAIDLNQNGVRHEKIATILHRTTRSVEVKLNKLGYKQPKRESKEKVICQNCGNKFKANKKDKRKFCSQSCSASFNNKHRKELKECLNCGNILNKKRQKYCSNKCQGQYKRRLIFEKIESGDTTLHTDNYRRYLIWKYGAKCMDCGWGKRHPITGNIPVQMEHIDGNSENNELSNLKLLCPNCHSLTPTFGSLNRGNGREKRRLKRQNLI